MKPATATPPPPGALQAAAAVQAVARQQQNPQHISNHSMNSNPYGKGGKPLHHYISQQQQISKPIAINSSPQSMLQQKISVGQDQVQQQPWFNSGQQQTPNQQLPPQPQRFQRPQMNAIQGQSQPQIMQQQQIMGQMQQPRLTSILISNQANQQQTSQMNHQLPSQQTQSQQVSSWLLKNDTC